MKIKIFVNSISNNINQKLNLFINRMLFLKK